MRKNIQPPTSGLQPPASSLTWRIAFVNACPYPLPQGSQILFRDTALALKHRGHDANLVVYGYGVGKETSGLPIHRCARIPGVRRTASGPSLAKPFMDAALVQTLRRVIRDQKIDIVHAHNYEGLMVALAAGKRPIVYHAHNAMADELPYFTSFGKWVGRWFDRTFPKRADAVIVPHSRLADYLITCGCHPSKVNLIFPGVNVSAFKEAPVAQKMPPVLYTGNLDAYQNLGFLKKVMARIRDTAPQARLIIATAPHADFPQAEIANASDLKRLSVVLAQDCVVVCPRVSWSGYPIKLLNAMAAGKAIVACQSAAYPLANEKNGLVVPDNNVPAFAQAVLRLMTDTDLRSRLGSCARETVIHYHDPDSIAAEIEEIYGKLLETPGANSA